MNAINWVPATEQLPDFGVPVWLHENGIIYVGERSDEADEADFWKIIELARSQGVLDSFDEQARMIRINGPIDISHPTLMPGGKSRRRPWRHNVDEPQYPWGNRRTGLREWLFGPHPKLAAWWARLLCRHSWTPVFHSYRCNRCGKLDKEF